eukprot:9792579-Alexandrium_andersonii.AAC.1
MSHAGRLEEAGTTNPGRHARAALVVLCPCHLGRLARDVTRLPRSLELLEPLGGGVGLPHDSAHGTRPTNPAGAPPGRYQQPGHLRVAEVAAPGDRHHARAIMDLATGNRSHCGRQRLH